MLDFIKTWCTGIVLAAIITVIIEMLLPQGNIKKYVKVIIGIYLIFVIISPLIDNTYNIDIINSFEGEYNTAKVSNIEELSNIYVRAIESEIVSNFTYISDAQIFLTEDLEEIEKIEINLLESQSSLADLENYLLENYGITEEKIYIQNN